MKNENKKIYEKALTLYNEGKIDKAIEMCEIGISNSLKDSKLLNLKGLLLYTNGNLKEAIALWRINKDYNNDSISKAYIEDSKKDFDRYLMCQNAEELIENLYIDEALENLLECSKSDFNLIEVNNLIAIAYIKKGEYDNSRLALEKVLKIDKNNKKAKETLKEINNLLDIKNRKGLFITLLGGVVVLVLSIFIIYKIGIININLNENGIKNIITFKNNKEENNTDNEVNNKLEDNNLVKNSNSKDKAEDVASLLETDLDKKKDKSDLDKEKQQEIQNEENKLEDDFIVLTNSEIQSKYNDANYHFRKKEYKEAINIFEEIKKSSANSDLNNDILFLRAVSYQEIKDYEKAIDAYVDFLSKYDNGTYVEEAYYKLILLYEEKDIKISKEYAEKFTKESPNSIYNNNKVKEILNR